ncbi:probable cytochrome P450 6d4 [Contarinia nasturtii]|uniref:probable cytochrome P450 6d4 n=1 Tax=Contarinia nasturtii TaxID=265458 RepID=UPI0012D4B101|nr:probable cytochrome P450 6d4 [Contarinia nasturtii]
MVLFAEDCKIDALVILIGALTFIYFFLKRTYSYWERKGFKTLPNYSYIFGHFKETLTQKEFAGDCVKKLYASTNEPFIGIYSILRPILLVRDPELMRLILIKDFPSFTDRDVHCDEEYDPLSGILFSLPGQKWKNLRGKLSPAFSTGKLKAMFSTLHDCGSTLQQYLGKIADKEEILYVRDIAARHTTNVIASVGFGIDCDTIGNPNHDFRTHGRQIFESTFINAVRWFCFFFAPRLMRILRLKIVNSKVEHFLHSVVKQNLEYREKNGVVRKDYFQLLIQLRNTGTVQLDDEWQTVIAADENQKTLSLNEICSQTFMFFAAGFETSSTTLSFCLYELAKNPHIQQTVHDEIDRILNRNDDKITYESIFDMKYLEVCIDETLRKYATLPILNRTCVKNYQIPGTDKVIEKGTQVFIPVMALHWDEKYFDDPEKFIPERFNEENSVGKNMINRPYLPFGEGPRNCVGMRLGKLQIKGALVMMLQKFRFELSDHHKNNDIKFDPKNFLITSLGGIHLRVFKR